MFARHLHENNKMMVIVLGSCWYCFYNSKQIVLHFLSKNAVYLTDRFKSFGIIHLMLGANAPSVESFLLSILLLLLLHPIGDIKRPYAISQIVKSITLSMHAQLFNRLSLLGTH